MAEKYLLQVKNLKIALKVDKNFIPIVDDVDLSLEPGKVLGLVGESGCGKSVTALSLLRLLSKELKIVDGKILFYGQNGDGAVDIAKLEPKGKDIQRIRGGDGLHDISGAHEFFFTPAHHRIPNHGGHTTPS